MTSTFKATFITALAKKDVETRQSLPIPINRVDAAATKPTFLSAPVRDLADLLAQIAVEKFINKPATAHQQ